MGFYSMLQNPINDKGTPILSCFLKIVWDASPSSV